MNIPPRPEGESLLVVMSYDKREQPCSECGETALVFSAHNVKRGTVVDRCKACLERIAETEELAIYVKTTWPKLREVWTRNRRPEVAPWLDQGARDYRSKKHAERASRVSTDDSGHSVSAAETRSAKS